MQDYSLLIIKPEILQKKEKVFQSLKKRGYKILFTRKFNNWKCFARKIYTEFSKKQIKNYLDNYAKNNWSNSFIVVLVRHKSNSTIKRLKKEEGNFESYQKNKEHTLRAEFGLPKEKNIIVRKRVFSYTGIHCVKNKKELEKHLKLLKLNPNFKQVS